MPRSLSQWVKVALREQVAQQCQQLLVSLRAFLLVRSPTYLMVVQQVLQHQLVLVEHQPVGLLVVAVEHQLLENQEQIVTSQAQQFSMAQVERVLHLLRVLQARQIPVTVVAQEQVPVEQVDLALQYCALPQHL